MKVTKTMLQTMINYKHVASTDETRPYLNTIALTFGDNTVTLTACDGYKMMRSMHVIVNSDIVDGDKHYLVHTCDLKRVATYIKEDPSDSYSLEIQDNYLSIGTFKDDPEIVKLPLCQRDYPPVDVYFETKETKGGVQRVIFSPLHYMDIVKAIAPMKRQQNKLSGLKLRFQNDFEAIFGTKEFEGVKHEYLLMPIKE